MTLPPLIQTADRIDQLQSQPPPFQICRQIRSLVDRYFSTSHLHDRLEELPLQFANPQPRPWKPIDWQSINASQITGMAPQVFLDILQGAIDTEAPIRGYTQTSRQYLAVLHPPMAQFVGGIVVEGVLVEPGLWEKEERQHTPALSKLCAQLANQKVVPQPHLVRAYRPSADPRRALYRHGLHRIATEYGAACLYLWLMAHSSGALQAVLEELVLDEINHMAKFLGFGIWAFPEASLPQLGQTLLSTRQITYSRDRSSFSGTLHRMTEVLHWQAWSWVNRATFALTCIEALRSLWCWTQQLQRSHLQVLFGEPSFGEPTR